VSCVTPGAYQAPASRHGTTAPATSSDATLSAAMLRELYAAKLARVRALRAATQILPAWSDVAYSDDFD
jgi:hypothetical protein